ncbi:hypothetical protein FQR65_LT03352 [Abscondita terminalis]|nr:hypothetical protein FQR65_LT03352 [Abscondita terminalis]
MYRGLEDEEYVSENFDVHYINKVIEEITEWKLCYTKIKQEYKELKTQSNEESSNQEPLDFKFEDYPMKVEQLHKRINSVVNMHKHLLRYKSIRMEQIENSIKSANIQIGNKLNVH